MKGTVVAVCLLFLLVSCVPILQYNDIIEEYEVDNKDTCSLDDKKDINWWPMFHHDPSHNSYSTSIAPETNNVLWNFTTGSDIDSSPAVYDGRVYIASNDDTLYCVDMISGMHIWNCTVITHLSSPAVYDGKVYIGSLDKNLYCFDAYTGDEIWNCTTDGEIHTSPTIYAGNVYISVDNRNIYCLDGEDGSEVWNFDTGPYFEPPLTFMHQNSSPCISDGKVFIGGNDHKLYCFGSQPVLDVNQSNQDRGFPIRHAMDGDWAAAQSFLITLNYLTNCEIYLRTFGTPEFNLTVELREDNPQGTLIETLEFTPDETPSSWEWFMLNFEDTSIDPGTEYFIVCPPAPPGVTTSFGYEWGYAFGNQYDDGSFWFTRDGGGLWRDLPTMYEFCFMVYGYD